MRLSRETPFVFQTPLWYNQDMQGGRPTGSEPAIPPWPGRILELAWRAPQRWMWLGAGWAALCGTIASGELQLDGATFVRLAALLLLTDGLLGAVWKTLAAVSEGLSASALNPTPTGEATRTVAVPELGEEATGAKASATFRLTAFPAPLSPRVGRWVTEAGRRGVAAKSALQQWLIAVGMALVVSLLLGPMVATFAALGILFPLVAAFALGGPPLGRGLTRAVVEVLLPWSLGLVSFSSAPDLGAAPVDRMAATVLWVAVHGTHFLIAGLFSGVYYALLSLDQRARLRWWLGLLTLAQGLGAVLLVLWRQPLLAGTAGFLWLAQLPFRPYLRAGHVRWYLHHTQWFVMAWMLTVSLGVALR